MRQRTRGRLVGAIFAAGLVGGWRWVTHPRWHNPRFRRRLRRRWSGSGPLPPPNLTRAVRCRLLAAGGSARAPPAPPRHSRRRSIRSDRADRFRRHPGGQNPTPYVGQPVSRRRRSTRPMAPSPEPPSRSHHFQRPIADRAMAEQAIHISSNPPVPGRFYWVDDTQVRWRPEDFWPAGTAVNIDASGTKSSFTVPEQLVATIDNKYAPDGDHAQREVGEDIPGVDGQVRGMTPRTAPTTCSRSSPTS